MTKLAQWIVALAVSALAMGFALVDAAKAQEAAGEWHGVLATPQGELRLGLTVKPKAGGGFEGALASPDQGPGAVPADTVTLENGQLSFTVARFGVSFAGHWDAARKAWVGVFTQGGKLDLVLLPGPVPERARPQLPKPPFPYREEEVKVASVPGVTLACTLTEPAGKGPFPAVTLITGSGAQDRDEALAGHRPFLVLADHLTRRGVAVLRCDDRGFAKSTGVFAEATSPDFAKDTEAEAAYLRSRPDIDARRVGLVGHSEGGMIAPMVAAADPKIAFIVLMAGPGAPIRDLMVAQRAAVAKAQGVDPAMLARNEAVLVKLNAAVSQAKDSESALAAAKAILKTDVPSLDDDAAAKQAQPLAMPWYRWFIAYDPRPTLAQVKVPILAIDGSKDVQVVASQNLPAIREATRANRDVTVVELPGLNHLFQTAGTGGPGEYARIEETISPVALNTISDWIAARAKPKGR